METAQYIKKGKNVSQKRKNICIYGCRTRVPSTYNVCKRWKQESLCVELEDLNLWAQDSPFFRIHREKMASPTQSRKNDQQNLKISQKRPQMKDQTARFRHRTTWKRLNTPKKTKSVRQKKKRKIKIVVGQGQFPQTMFAMTETGILVFLVGGSQIVGLR